jgi:hypothetical protein
MTEWYDEWIQKAVGEDPGGRPTYQKEGNFP